MEVVQGSERIGLKPLPDEYFEIVSWINYSVEFFEIKHVLEDILIRDIDDNCFW